MLNPFTARLLVVVALFSGSITGAMAADRNLIQTLYHSDFDEVGDGGQPRFTLDGEVGLLSASGNTNANSLKAALHSEHETAKWNNNYFAEMLYKQSKTENDDGETNHKEKKRRQEMRKEKRKQKKNPSILPPPPPASSSISSTPRGWSGWSGGRAGPERAAPSPSGGLEIEEETGRRRENGDTGRRMRKEGEGGRRRENKERGRTVRKE